MPIYPHFIMLLVDCNSSGSQMWCYNKQTNFFEDVSEDDLTSLETLQCNQKCLAFSCSLLLFCAVYVNNVLAHPFLIFCLGYFTADLCVPLALPKERRSPCGALLCLPSLCSSPALLRRLKPFAFFYVFLSPLLSSLLLPFLFLSSFFFLLTTGMALSP